MDFCDEHRLLRPCNVCYGLGAERVELKPKLRNYWRFLDRFNLLQVEVKKGKLVLDSAPNPDKVPREMLWYYGLDKLVLTS